MVASSTPIDIVSSFWVWLDVWKSEFPDIVVREHRSVDTKDKILPELRRMMRRKVTTCADRRQHIKYVRKRYRASLRTERTFYWVARLRPCEQPLRYMTYIQDGATQK